MNRRIYDISAPEPLPPRPTRNPWLVVVFAASAALLVLALLYARASRPKVQAQGNQPIQDTRSYRMPFRST